MPFFLCFFEFDQGKCEVFIFQLILGGHDALSTVSKISEYRCRIRIYNGDKNNEACIFNKRVWGSILLWVSLHSKICEKIIVFQQLYVGGNLLEVLNRWKCNLGGVQSAINLLTLTTYQWICAFLVFLCVKHENKGNMFWRESRKRHCYQIN